jgi:hypothetical protein
MTSEKYYNMCEQIGEEPNPNRVPPSIDEFPSDVQKALYTFNKLGDKIIPDIGYIGKDYTTVGLYIEIENVTNKYLFMETLLRLDSRVITKSAEKRKREMDKLTPSKTPGGVGR